MATSSWPTAEPRGCSSAQPAVVVALLPQLCISDIRGPGSRSSSISVVPIQKDVLFLELLWQYTYVRIYIYIYIDMHCVYIYIYVHICACIYIYIYQGTLTHGITINIQTTCTLLSASQFPYSFHQKLCLANVDKGGKFGLVGVRFKRCSVAAGTLNPKH